MLGLKCSPGGCLVDQNVLVLRMLLGHLRKIVNPRELHKSYAIGSSFSDIWWLIRAFYSGSFKDKIVLGFPHLKELSLDTRNAHLLEFE